MTGTSEKSVRVIDLSVKKDDMINVSGSWVDRAKFVEKLRSQDFESTAKVIEGKEENNVCQ